MNKEKIIINLFTILTDLNLYEICSSCERLKCMTDVGDIHSFINKWGADEHNSRNRK